MWFGFLLRLAIHFLNNMKTWCTLLSLLNTVSPVRSAPRLQSSFTCGRGKATGTSNYSVRRIFLSHVLHDPLIIFPLAVQPLATSAHVGGKKTFLWPLCLLAVSRTVETVSLGHLHVISRCSPEGFLWVVLWVLGQGPFDFVNPWLLLCFQ